MNSEGENITAIICAAARGGGVDPVALLALLQAESGLNPCAERWGGRTSLAREGLEAHDRDLLDRIVASQWPDISFGYGQQIVLYHYLGDGSSTLDNVLAVREGVFADPEGNIINAAERLANGIRRSADGSPLGGMVVYNAGTDRRSDPAWMARWAGNVASYERALAWAETYRA